MSAISWRQPSSARRPARFASCRAGYLASVIEVRQESASAADPAAVVDCGSSNCAEGVVRCVDLAVRLGHTKVVVDLGGRDGADADLLGVLHRSARRMRETGGRLAVVSASSRLRRLLHLTLLSHAFGVYATREEALAG